MRVVVDHHLTYEAPDTVQIGDAVVLPTADFLRDVKGPTYEGTVTALESSYTGPCRSIIRVKTPTADPTKAVDLLREFEKGVDANFTGPENAGHRGWLKIQIHNVIIALGRKPYAIHEKPVS